MQELKSPHNRNWGAILNSSQFSDTGKPVASHFKRALWAASVTLLVVSGCSSPNQDDQTIEKDLVSESACQEVEYSAIAASEVFQTGVGLQETAGVAESVELFVALNDLWSASFEHSFGTSGVDESLADDFLALTEGVSEAKGLLSDDFQTSRIGEIIQPPLTQLQAACRRWHQSNLAVDELFTVQGDLIQEASEGNAEFEDYELMTAPLQEQNLEVLMLRAAEVSGLVTCEQIIGPNFEKVLELKSASLVTFCSLPESQDGTYGGIAIYRFEDSNEQAAGVAALKRFTQDVENGWSTWVLESSGMAAWGLAKGRITNPEPFSILWDMDIAYIRD